MRVTLAMLFYFGLVFGVGFLLGPIRVLWLEPRFGPIIATACEVYVVGHPGRGALGTTRPEHRARSKNACLDWSWLFGFAANCRFLDRLLAAGHLPKRTICSAADWARQYLRCVAGIVCNHALGCQLLARPNQAHDNDR
jgi:hypothetical protein